MIKQLKTLTTSIIAGANTVTAALMLMAGFSDHIDPASHPMLACVGLSFPIFLCLNLAFLVFWVFVKWRMAAIPTVAFLVAYQPIRTYIPLNRSKETPPGAMKVLSYNVQGFNAQSDDQDFNDIISYIKESGADIVCLQEAMFGKNDVDSLLNPIYPHSSITRIGERQDNTLALFTRYDIVRTESIEYASVGNGSVAYYLKKGRDTILVVNNHFESNRLTPDEKHRYKEMLKGEMEQDTAREESRKLLHKLADAAKRRAPQADAVHKYIEAHKRYPTIVCGDFNDNPISYTRRTVAKGLTDCYISSGNGVGLSYNQKGFYVRIDNIMCSQDYAAYNCKVDNKIESSDHYPIFCWLKKQEKP
jgi:endonuclease/exonuclease/phosphatase family metal-dependent hydrolase